MIRARKVGLCDVGQFFPRQIGMHQAKASLGPMLNTTVMVFPIARGGRFGVVSSLFQLSRIRLFGLILLAINLAGCGFTLAPPGFVREHRHSVCRGSLDWNSHRRCSLTLETYDRLPPDSARVKLFRWSHLGSVDKPREIVFADEFANFPDPQAQQIPVNPSSEQTLADPSPGEPENGGGVEFVPPPPAPPSEMEDSGFPPNDATGPMDQDSVSSDGQSLPAIPLVNISFSENLNEPGEEDPINSPECSMPQGNDEYLIPNDERMTNPQ